VTKFIVVAGGVISGVGKGVASASIGRILKDYGFSVTAVKIDPYINLDAGTMRPTEHGEVWVTNDGGETDQDLGNYERFLDVEIPKSHNITTGQIYKTLIEKERSGEFLGETVEVIPHVPEEVKSRIISASKGFDICIVEIGGTLGEYQNSIFLFALRSLENDIGKDNICYMLVSYLPIPSHIDEMKTKPTQLAVTLMRQAGVEPDFLLCRGKVRVDDVRKHKLGRNINIPSESVISMPDVTGENTPNSLYVIPLELQSERLGEKLLKRLCLEPKINDGKEWLAAVNRMLSATREVKIAMIGKYLNIGDYQLADSYLSVNEALRHACAMHDARLKLIWIDSKKLEDKNYDVSELKQYDGIVVPGGFGSTGVEGKIRAIKFCRENDVPYLGLCFGLQLAVVEFARNVCGLIDAHTTEINSKTSNPVIDILPEQKAITKKGGTMRLGAYDAILVPGTIVHDLYGKDLVSERHRHRYEVNPEYHDILKKHGLIISGMSPDRRLVEFIELPNHKFFVATQAHPEFKSTLLHPAPLFGGFIVAALKK